ncbi:MAG: geranyl transferase, partial [Gammaproteobacteria bacterium]
MAETTQKQLTEQVFADWVSAYTERVTECLERALPDTRQSPHKLHEAMRYAVFSGGKRVRPLLVYATGECLGVAAEKLDALAMAIELIHAFSLVHDDLPAMDDDDLRRGQPTVHRRFDEATAILAADALQPLAFQVIAGSTALSDKETRLVVQAVAEACGSLGMTGGQSIDLDSEGRILSIDELAEMHNLKTGALFRACVMSVTCLVDDLTTQEHASLDQFSRDIGLAFQIRDDILDVKGETAVIGKQAGADQRMDKATWPALFGLEESVDRCDELVRSATQDL